MSIAFFEVAMTEQERLVKMRVDVDEEFRNRIKSLAYRMGLTMGELIERLSLSDDSLNDLERQYFGDHTTSKEIA
jgi:hypothetical protein